MASLRRILTKEDAAEVEGAAPGLDPITTWHAAE